MRTKGFDVRFLTLPRLSIVIPAHNEERYIGVLLQKIHEVDLRAFAIDKEIIVIDDGSTDRTAAIAEASPASAVVVRMPQQRGKGHAVRAGISRATGDYLIIQDADLEYEPGDYVPMLNALLAGGADAVYGSRYIAHGRYRNQSAAAYLGGRSLSVATYVFTGRYLTDTVAALKLFHRERVVSLRLETEGFELDHEITAKLAWQGARFVEVPVRYAPRNREQGKKVGAWDWFVAVRTILRYRRG